MQVAMDSDTGALAPHHGRAPLVTALCFLLMATEGLDNNVISFISPMLREEYSMSVEMVGLLYSVTVVASLVGALLLAPLSDRFGRRPVVILCSSVLGLCSLGTPLVHTPLQLLILRFFVGVAFGATVPVVFALVAEFAPPKRKSFLIMLTSSGVASGYMLAGFISGTVIPIWGWRVLMFGLGGASMVVVATLIAMLPDSPALLDRRARARSGAEPVQPLPEGKKQVEPKAVIALLTQPYLLMTVLIWAIVSAVYAVEFTFGYWLPTLLMSQGFTIREAGYVTAIGKIGGISGTLAVGWMMDRWGARRILSSACMTGAVLMALLPLALGSPVAATCGILITALATSGSFSGAQALAVMSYPLSMRATATGWIAGFARFVGGGAGALVGGAMLGAGYEMGSVCRLMAVWMLVAFFGVLGLGRYQRGRQSAGELRTAIAAE